MGRAFEFRKARKMKRWSAMSKAFTRIGKDIVMAVKEGGPCEWNTGVVNQSSLILIKHKKIPLFSPAIVRKIKL